MGANLKIEQVAKPEEQFNKRLLYRAYDLILSWPLPETAVSDGAGEAETPQGHQSPSNNRGIINRVNE